MFCSLSDKRFLHIHKKERKGDPISQGAHIPLANATLTKEKMQETFLREKNKVRNKTATFNEGKQKRWKRFPTARTSAMGNKEGPGDVVNTTSMADSYLTSKEVL